MLLWQQPAVAPVRALVQPAETHPEGTRIVRYAGRSATDRETSISASSAAGRISTSGVGAACSIFFGNATQQPTA